MIDSVAFHHSLHGQLLCYSHPLITPPFSSGLQIFLKVQARKKQNFRVLEILSKNSLKIILVAHHTLNMFRLQLLTRTTGGMSGVISKETMSKRKELT